VVTDKTRRRNSLSLAVRAVKRMGKMKGLEEAINAARQSVETTPDGHPDLTGRMHSLGVLLWMRYGRTRNMSDLRVETCRYLSSPRAQF
jgi:hypothetical protein